MSSKLKATVASVSLSILSCHNNKRNYKVFLPVLNELINKVLNTGSANESLKRFDSIKLIDYSTTISMSLNRSTKVGIKVHTRFDLNKGIHDTFVVANAVEHDKTEIYSLIDNKHCIYVFDKGHLDYKKIDQYTKGEKYFITRLKNNAVVTEIKNLKISHSYERLLNVVMIQIITGIMTFTIFKLAEPLIETKNYAN